MRKQLIKRYFITGLLIWVPLAITAWVMSLVASIADQSLRLFPETIQPHELIGFDIPGSGVAVTLLVIFVTGVLAANFIGQRLVNWWEKLLARIPVVNTIYNGVKQVSDTLFSPSGNAFRKALLIRYPHQNSRAIAFLTGAPGGDVVNHLETEHVSVYVPTTPNPTSGFFLMLPKSEVIELDMSIDEALKYIISMGVIAPPTPDEIQSVTLHNPPA